MLVRTVPTLWHVVGTDISRLYTNMWEITDASAESHAASLKMFVNVCRDILRKGLSVSRTFREILYLAYTCTMDHEPVNF